jgi:CIC family chloride channel protein
VLGVVCGAVGILYPRCFYGVRNLFRRLRLPNYFKPAIGGLAVGIIGLFLPQVLGMGYGWLQIVMQPQVIIPVGLMVLLAFAKIVATSLSIGSGGSGGVFAPGLFIGGMLGAAMWAVMQGNLPHVPASPEAFVVVGMMALFGGVAHAPLAVMFMVGEMTGSYTMLAPAMIAVGIAYVIVGKDTIYESQVASPAASPAHRYEYSFPLLGRLSVKDAMKTEVAPLTDRDTLEIAEKTFTADHLKSLPVVGSRNRDLVGIISREDLMRVPQRNGQKVSEFMTRDVITITPDDSLDTALELLSRYDVSSLPVLEKSEKGSKLLGMISRRDITRAYTRTAKSLLNKDLIVPQPGGKEN